MRLSLLSRFFLSPCFFLALFPAIVRASAPTPYSQLTFFFFCFPISFLWSTLFFLSLPVWPSVWRSPGSRRDRVYRTQFASIICLHAGTVWEEKDRGGARSACKRKKSPTPVLTRAHAQTQGVKACVLACSDKARMGEGVGSLRAPLTRASCSEINRGLSNIH